VTGEEANPGDWTSRWVPGNARSRGGAIGLAIFYLMLAAAMGAWVVTTDTVLMRWLWGVLCLGFLGLSATYWVAARNLRASQGRSDTRG
jgi:hypothetical protein